MTQAAVAHPELTIDDLARQSLLPVRTIREYHTMRLLPPPERRGRVGIYGPRHVQRLELVARLQRRGYSLAGIRDLLAAWDAGSDLTSLLGVDPGHVALDETPVLLTRAELTARLPGLTGPQLRRACAAGLVQASGKAFVVRSPALLALVADGAAAGASIAEMLDLVDTLRHELTALAGQLADHVVDQLAPALASGQDPGALSGLLQRGRLLLLQGAASMLADQLGSALVLRADAAADGSVLRAAIESIRVGAIADSAGHIRSVKR